MFSSNLAGDDDKLDISNGASWPKCESEFLPNFEESVVVVEASRNPIMEDIKNGLTVGTADWADPVTVDSGETDVTEAVLREA